MISTITQFISGDRPSGQPTRTDSATTRAESNGGRSGTDFVREDELVDSLIEQLRQDELPEEHRRLLREELVADVPASMEVQLEHLQSKVSQLDAYTAALETFINEHGTADDVLEAVQAGVAQAEHRIEALQSRVDALDADRETHRGRLSELETAIESVDAFVESLKGQHGREIVGVDAKVERLEARVDEAIDALEADIESNSEAVEDLAEVPALVAANEERIDELRSLRKEVRELQAMQEDVQSLRADVDGLEGFRRTFIETVSSPSAEATGD